MTNLGMELVAADRVSIPTMETTKMRDLLPMCALSMALALFVNAEAVSQTSPASQTPQPPENDKAAPAQNGAEEPSAASNSAGAGGPVFVNGALNVPGAPKDSQTAPAKFSSRNDAFDKLPIMAAAFQFTEAQKNRIATVLRNATPPVASFDGKPTEEVPFGIALSDIPASIKSEIPSLQGLKYVRSPASILLVDSTNGVVVGKIASDSQR